MTTRKDIFGARTRLQGTPGEVIYYQLDALTRHGVQGLDRLPFTIKIILENVLRQAEGDLVTGDEVLSLARWVPGASTQASKSYAEYPFFPTPATFKTLWAVPPSPSRLVFIPPLLRLLGNPQKVTPLVPPTRSSSNTLRSI